MKWNTGWLVVALSYGSLLACETMSTDNQAVGTGGDAATGTGGQSSGGQAVGGASGGESAALGERGSSCDSSGDCQDELSCIVTAGCPVGVACANKTCQPSNFEIMGTGKQCHIVQCESREDCCGDMPLEAPEKCDVRDITCSQPTLAGCSAISCTMDDQCGAGKCAGTCTYDGEQCLTLDDCAENVCEFASGSGGSGSGGDGSGGDGSGGTSGSGGSGGSGGSVGSCSLNGAVCYSDGDCAINSCSSPYCRCDNPDYDPTAPICEDEDCEGICGWTCEGQLCAVDLSCNIDSDCVNATPFCDDGACVQCLSDEDCEEDVACIAGVCGPECEADSECGLFEVCQDDACLYVGCQTDRECVLSAPVGSEQDPRLAVCLIEAGVGTCVFPCDIDAQCGPTEICVDSVCEYIGCDTDTECKTIAGLHDQPPPTAEQPWTTAAECRSEPTE
jgi:hypothetical protein